MADSVIALPYNATTSGDQLDATLLGAVKRERMVLGNDTSTAVAVVTSSGALRVSADVTGSFPFIISGSVTANLSSATSLSSGTVTLSSNPTVISASSGFVQVYQSTSPWAISGTVLSASSGLVQVLQSTGVWAISGTVAVSNPSTGVNLIGSTGGQAVVTSSGALSVTMSAGGAGSTAVSLAAGAGGLAPVTTSGGLTISLPTHLLTHLLATAIVPTLYQITTAPAILYSINGLSTQTVSNYMEFYANGTTVLTAATTFLVAANPITVGGFSNIFMSIAGVPCTGGITAVSRLTIGSTAGAVVTVRYAIEYSI